MIALLLLLTNAQADDPLLLETLAEWADRAPKELTLEGVKPSRATLAAADVETYVVTSELGALLSEEGWRSRPARVEVVVGDAALDSSRFAGGRRAGNPLAKPRLVTEDVGIAISRDLWLATDHSFKEAVKRYQVKSAALAQQGQAYPPDWTERPATVDVQLIDVPAIDRDALRAIALAGSAALREVPGLRTGRVDVRAADGHYMLATSEGSRIVQPEGAVVVYAWADVLREDGVQVYEYLNRVVRRTDDLPAIEQIVADIRALGERVAARAAAERVAYYEGPVVFEGDAALDFFRYLALSEVEGTPPVPHPSRTYEKQIRNGPRIGRRLLPSGWSLVDDPTAVPDNLPGGYVFDREGVRAQSISLVEDGIVRDLAMSRVPRHDRKASNGHARGSVQGTWQGRVANWTLTPSKTLSDKAFDKQVSKALKDSGAPAILVVRAMQRGRAGRLPRPTDAVWLRPDGTETPVLALEFQKSDRRSLRDVVALAGRQTRAYLAPMRSTTGASGSTGVPTVGTGPARLLVSELETVYPGATRAPHVLSAPPL
jgi:predicted Zn-dependent protease